MYNNQWFERSRVARTYSSISSASDLHARSELMSDFGVFARNFLNECNVDKRNIATSSDGELFKYDLISSNADNEGWADGIWMTLSLSRLIALLGDTGTPENPQKVLAEPVSQMHEIIDSPNRPDVDLYFINTPDFCMVEKFLQQSSHVADFSQLRYTVVDAQELVDGSLDQYFDLVRTYSRDLMFSTLSLTEGVLNSIKVGGRLSISTVSDYSSLYRDSLRTHENDYSILNKYLVNRSDFEIMHVPVEFGFAIGRRTS